MLHVEPGLICNAFLRVCVCLFHFHLPLHVHVPSRLTTEATLVPSMFTSPLASIMRAGGLAAVILAVQKQC